MFQLLVIINLGNPFALFYFTFLFTKHNILILRIARLLNCFYLHSSVVLVLADKGSGVCVCVSCRPPPPETHIYTQS